jgi:phosphoribosylformylglycinamidine synthase subunit PurS
VPVARVIVDVILKPEILDPQGQAILGALGRLGISGVSGVRQGKHFELDVESNVDDEVIARVADTLLANPVIEDFTIRR